MDDLLVKVALSGWLPVVGLCFSIVSILISIYGRRQARERRARAQRGLCTHCAYPAGISPTCTECGTPISNGALSDQSPE